MTASEDANKHVAQIQMKMADEKRRDKLTDRQRERQLLTLAHNLPHLGELPSKIRNVPAR